MAIPATDNFSQSTGSNQALTTYAPSNWAYTQGTFNVFSGANRYGGGTSSVSNLARWIADTFNADHSSEIEVTTAMLSNGRYCGPAVRLQSGAATGYHFDTNGSDNYIIRTVAGTDTQLGSQPVASFAAGDKIRMKAEGVGATVTLTVEKALAASPTSFSVIATYADTDAARITTAGAPGIFGYDDQGGNGATNWKGDNLAAAATLEQEGFQWLADDANEAGSSPLAAQDTNITRALDTNTRLRALINATNDPATKAFRLDYKKSTDSVWRAVPLSSPISESVDKAVTLGTDDAQQITTTMTLTGTTIGASLDATTEWVGMRFQGVTVPPGATITSAYISVVPSGTGEDEPLVDISLENADNPGTFTTTASDISNRTRTSTVSWSSADLGASGSSYHNSPDLSSIVQTVVNRAGWASGNAMVVIIQGGATTTRDLTIEAFENAGANPPLLHIAYTIPAPILISASSNITAGGEATTARLTAPSGKSTSDFVTGRMWDDENGTDSIDITTDDYAEVEWCLKAVSANGAANGHVYDFRVTVGGVVLDTYTVTPSLTIGSTAAGFIPRNTSRMRPFMHF